MDGVAVVAEAAQERFSHGPVAEDDEIQMILTPHIVRMPEWTKTNFKAIYTGSESKVQVRHESELQAPQQPQADAQTRNAQGSALRPRMGMRDPVNGELLIWACPY